MAWRQAVVAMALGTALAGCGPLEVGIDDPPNLLDLGGLPACAVTTEPAPAHPLSSTVAAPKGWRRLDGSISSEAGPWNAGMALDREGQPWVATIDGQSRTTPYVYVWRREGKHWSTVGPGLDAVADDGTPQGSLRIPAEAAITVGLNGKPVVAWSEVTSATASALYVCAWDGEVWRRLGDALRGHPGTVGVPSLQLDRNGRPVLAWNETSLGQATSHLHIWRWIDSDWVPVGNAPDAAAQSEMGLQASASGPALRLDGEDQPLLAWSEAAPDSTSPLGKRSRVYVSRWTGSSWVGVGGAIGLGDGVGLALTSMGAPVAGWVVQSSFEGLRSLAFARWNGSTWEPLPSPGSGAQLSFELDSEDSIITAREVPDAQGTSFALEVQRLERSQNWKTLATGLEAVQGAQTDTYRFLLRTDPEGRPAVAWIEYSQPPKTKDNFCGLFVAQQITAAGGD